MAEEAPDGHLAFKQELPLLSIQPRKCYSAPFRRAAFRQAELASAEKPDARPGNAYFGVPRSGFAASSSEPVFTRTAAEFYNVPQEDSS
jgi:hypothetical protein